jgi:hypothetical protein
MFEELISIILLLVLFKLDKLYQSIFMERYIKNVKDFIDSLKEMLDYIEEGGLGSIDISEQLEVRLFRLTRIGLDDG